MQIKSRCCHLSHLLQQPLLKKQTSLFDLKKCRRCYFCKTVRRGSKGQKSASLEACISKCYLITGTLVSLGGDVENRPVISLYSSCIGITCSHSEPCSVVLRTLTKALLDYAVSVYTQQIGLEAHYHLPPLHPTGQPHIITTQMNRLFIRLSQLELTQRFELSIQLLRCVGCPPHLSSQVSSISLVPDQASAQCCVLLPAVARCGCLRKPLSMSSMHFLRVLLAFNCLQRFPQSNVLSMYQ